MALKEITYDDTKFQLVPKEPTDEMLYHGCKAGLDTGVLLDDTRFSSERAIWKAMLEKSPKSL